MRIYVDIDDVLCETAASLCGVAAREFGRHVPYAEVRQFDLQQVFGLTDEEMKRFRVVSHAPETLASYPVTPGAVAGVRALRAAAHAVEIVTGRPASSHVGTEAWLTAAGLGDFAVTYVDKYGRDACYAHNPGDPATVPLAELMMRHYDVAIDDSPAVLGHLAQWTKTRILVFSRPWNEAFGLSPNMTRVRGWQDIVETLGS